MKSMWDERYSDSDYAYGIEPNEFLRHYLPTLETGRILFPAEGEGRNAVYAAQLGWEVDCFDLSVEGKKKATQLALQHQVAISYQVGDIEHLEYEAEQFDAIALIYAHFSAASKSAAHAKLDSWLRPGGMVIFEAFSKSHIRYNSVNGKVGGPKDVAMLFSVDELQQDFPNYEFLLLEETEVELNEGKYHIGTGSVIRFIGRKRSRV